MTGMCQFWKHNKTFFSSTENVKIYFSFADLPEERKLLIFNKISQEIMPSTKILFHILLDLTSLRKVCKRSRINSKALGNRLSVVNRKK